jgi:pyruvate-formate lyase-activating enzyme
MVKFDLDHENRVIKAIDALSKQDTTNIKALAQEYSVSYDTLRRRFLGVPPHTRLSEAQEHALYRRIRSQVAHGFPMQKKQIVACAEWILQLSSRGKAQTLGGHWFTRSKRHPEMHEIHIKAMENSRKSACSVIDIVKWLSY